MEIKESNLTFCFSNETAIKFDETPYYRDYFNSFPGAKGVDVLYDSSEHLVLLEIKNCLGHEAENRWRIAPNNLKCHLAPEGSSDRDSLDIEIAQKVSMSIACLCGAATFGTDNTKASALIPFSAEINSRKISARQKKLLVVLFLEGDFGGRTRTKKMLMESLQISLRKKLKWLNCTVSVVDSSTYSRKIFALSE